MARTAVIAGVGPDLGASLACKFAREGCDVGLLARSGEYVADLAADLPDPGEGLGVETDISDPEQVEAAFDQVRDVFGPVDRPYVAVTPDDDHPDRLLGEKLYAR